jgi:hypothetical protein
MIVVVIRSAASSASCPPRPHSRGVAQRKVALGLRAAMVGAKIKLARREGAATSSTLLVIIGVGIGICIALVVFFRVRRIGYRGHLLVKQLLSGGADVMSVSFHCGAYFLVGCFVFAFLPFSSHLMFRWLVGSTYYSSFVLFGRETKEL